MTAPRGREAAGAGAPEPPADADAPEFALRLPAFEGPLDLLLHLIERRELDVTAVSLLEVTEQYLAHLRAGDRIDVARLAEFIAIGARLLLLKSRALLPRAPEEEDGAEEEDAEALVAALREYKRYRDVAGELRERGDAGRSYRREAPPPERPPGSGLDGVEVEALAAVFRGVLERFAAEQASQAPPVPRARVRLRERIELLVARLEEERRLSFRRLLEGSRSRLQVVVDFLAVLELIKAGFVEATQSVPFGDIELERRAGALPPVTAQLSLDLPDQ